MAVREGRWDCQYCGAMGNLGRNKDCHNCGRSRPAGTRFYLAEDSEVVNKKLEQEARIGPDWACDYCGTSNAADKTVCGSCGAAREESSQQQDVQVYAPGAAPTTGDMTIDPDPRATMTQAEPEKRSKLPILAIAGGAVLLCILGIVLFAVFGGGEAAAAVQGFEWQRTLDIELYQTVKEDDWSVPDGGRVYDQQQEIHHTVEILDHYESREREVSEQVQVGERTYVCGQRDLGNGFFEDIQCTDPVYETQTHTEQYEEPIYRQDPIFQTKYYYEIEKWIVSRTERSSGRDHTPEWPVVNLSNSEREGERSGIYHIIFEDDEGKTYTYETGLEEWQRFEVGQGVNLKLNSKGEIKEVERS